MLIVLFSCPAGVISWRGFSFPIFSLAPLGKDGTRLSVTTPTPSIDQLQPFIYGKLQSESLFASIVIFQDHPERTSSEIDERLASVGGDSRQGPAKKPGAAIVVKEPIFVNVNANAPGPEASVSIVVQIRENPRINIEAKDSNGVSTGTGITGKKWAQNVWQAIHLQTFQGIAQTIYAVSIKPNTEFEHLDLYAYDVTFSATFPLQAPLKVLLPTPSMVGTTITLASTIGPVPTTNPQPASPVIYYTTDGSFPGSSTATALVYQSPFTVPLYTTVQWAAYAPGYNGSDVGWAYIEPK
jgi:hypothetical protein